MFEILRAAAIDTEDRDHWLAVRRLPRESDNALNGTSRQWLRSLPARRRPLRLCTDYPRVANRIAWCWPDAELAAQVLDDLLVDRRGGRRGFPAPVQRELRRLQEFNAAQRVEPAPARRKGVRPQGILPALGRLVGFA
jgi:hypothetical protein